MNLKYSVKHWLLIRKWFEDPTWESRACLKETRRLSTHARSTNSAYANSRLGSAGAQGPLAVIGNCAMRTSYAFKTHFEFLKSNPAIPLFFMNLNFFAQNQMRRGIPLAFGSGNQKPAIKFL